MMYPVLMTTVLILSIKPPVVIFFIDIVWRFG
jgi:hypothetical protein